MVREVLNSILTFAIVTSGVIGSMDLGFVLRRVISERSERHDFN